MNFAAVVGRHSGRATPSLRDARQRQLTSTTGRKSTYRKRNAVQTKPATSLDGLSAVVRVELLAHAGLLAQFGPTLGRPTVDTLKGSAIANLKELRFNAEGGVWRVAFAFDVKRIAVLLAAADKRGQPQARFYKALIALAERRWATWT